MRYYRLFFMAVLLTLVGRMYADNMTVVDVELNPGESKTASINLENPTKKYTAFQFDLVLPEGVTVELKNNGKPKISLNEDRIDDHTLTVQDLGSGSYRLLCFSMSNAELYGTSGTLITMTLHASENASTGAKTGSIKSQVFTEASGDQVKWNDVSFTVTIAAAVVPEITADNKSREYGEENPAFTYTTSASLTGEPSLTTTATKTSPVGEYDIVVERGTVTGDYTAKNGKLTITKAPLTITAKSYTIKQGDALPTFEAEYSGFKNNETASVLSNQPTVRTEATLASEPGTYDIIVSGASATNYDITYVKGTLTITKADEIVVTAKSYNRQYGEANPNFEYTTAGATLSGTPAISCAATVASPVGEYDIVASKGSVTNYNVTYVNGKLTITKAPLTITAKSYTIKQGDALPTFEAEYSGFKNNETKAVLTTQPTIKTTATSASAPGTYDIIVSGASATNYDITYVKGTLTITAADPVTVTAKSYSRNFGEANPAFEYTTSGATLTGTPNISCVATASSSVGEYPIVITKGSVTNYNDNYVNGTLTIKKAPLTITAKSYTIKQGDALPTFEAEYSGFKNNETKSVLTTQPTIRTTATSASAPGIYDIIVSGAAANNYDITYVKGTLTITKADEVVVTAKSYSRQYGGANPNLEYTTAGATLSGTPAISCTATATSPVGEYDIVASKGSITNYNVTYVNGKLTITKAPLTITAKSYTIKQGDALPTFEAEYSGFKNNETKAVLTTQPTITTTATSASEPGTYDIVVSNASATNYDITYVKGTLTITKADEVVVMAKSYSRQYGEANPNFEYTISGTSLSGSPSVSCAATATSPVGEYDIVASKGSVTSYNVTYVNGKLTIIKAPLTVTAKSYTIKQGDALPMFEAEYSGFKNNETASVLSNQPTVRTEATLASEPGTYDIIVSGASATNYDITYVKGTLTITKADEIVVTAKSYNRQYGEANPNFEYTTAGATLSGTPAISCAATVASPVGEYDIVASKGSVTNYNVTYVNGKLTITKAPLTVTAKSYTIKQGDALPTFEAEYSGFKNNETANVLSTQPNIRTTATSASEPGTYDIIVSGAAANNYDISYVKGTLTIIAIDVEPVTEKTNTFSESINANTDLSNTVIDNTYYTLNSANGDGYDTAEQAIVLNSTTSESQMNSIENAEIGDAAIRQNYNGIIFEVAAGSGTITIDAKTNGTHVLNVQIGKAKPSQITRSTRGTADVTYSVTMPTYIYLYASTASTNAVQTRAISANSVLLYSYKVAPNTTGIQNISMEKPVDVYDMRGILVRTKVTTLNGLAKGIYIVNGRKVIVE